MVKEVMRGGGGRRGGRRVRVRATGTPGVTTVNAVQTTVKGEGGWYRGRTSGRSLAAARRVKDSQVHQKPRV